MHNADETRRATRHRRRLTVGLLFLLPVACTLFAAPPRVAPQQWAKGRGPVIPHDTFPADCTLCHLPGSWDRIRADFRYDHGKETGVALRGAHAAAECLRCHNDKGPVATFARRGCAGCHEDWHRRQLGANCGDCHDETDWLPKESVARHGQTRFPLIGAHAGVACFACHEGAQVGNFKRASILCETCHQADLARTTAPDHRISGWTSGCQRCHVPISWTGSAFVHNTFPLTGAHATLACNRCHVGGVYKGTPRTCAGCHLDDYNRTTNPNHGTAGFPTSCEACHTTTTWNGATFNHKFPLQGDHNVSCGRCHTTPANFSVFDCLGCHTKTRTDDDHSGVRNYSYSSTACYSCHPRG